MTTPFDAPDWRKLSRAELDRGLNNGEAVAGSSEIVVGWERQSAELRKRHPDHLDLRYGPRERSRKPLSLVVGSAELPLLRKQTADFAGHRAMHGLPVTYEEIPGADHFSIMNEMASPMGRITTLIRQLFARTG
jgi:hypothetical protein